MSGIGSPIHCLTSRLHLGPEGQFPFSEENSDEELVTKDRSPAAGLIAGVPSCVPEEDEVTPKSIRSERLIGVETDSLGILNVVVYDVGR